MAISPDLNNEAAESRQRANRKLGVWLACVAVLFVGFGFAMVPLYNVFCRVTGFNGRTNATAAVVLPGATVDERRWVKVEFLSHSMPGVGVELTPEQFSMEVHPGALVHASYVGYNRTNRPFVGQAVPSITPATATRYFQKIQCFCFSQQAFAPGERRTLPVIFMVNPKMDADLRTVTLSYTFFEAPQPKI